MKRITAALILLPSLLAAQEVDENELFGSTDTVVSADTLKSAKTDEDLAKRHFGVSGTVKSVNEYQASTDYVQDGDTSRNRFTPYVVAALTADARQGTTKAIANADVIYDGRTDESSYELRELFVQFNLASRLYFTVGKQVLAWGRCMLWNPTDLVNAEKLHFTEQIGSREGAGGLKLHIPFGTRVNLYGFASTEGADDLTGVKGAGKIEFTAGGTEAALSAFGRDGEYPVAGADISTRLGPIDVRGEAAYHHRDRYDRVLETAGMLTTERDERRFVRAALNLGKSFDLLEKPDRLSVNLEGYYNGAGEKHNRLKDERIYLFDRPVTVDDGAGNTATLAAGEYKAYLLGRELYEENGYSRWYAAAFITIDDFITSDITLGVNTLCNIAQRSFASNIALDYQDITDFLAGASVTAYYGDTGTEYTAAGRAFDARVYAGLLF